LFDDAGNGSRSFFLPEMSNNNVVMKRKRKLHAKVNAAFAGFSPDNADHPADSHNSLMITRSVTLYENRKKETGYTLSVGLQMIEDISRRQLYTLASMLNEFIKNERSRK
jgi:hypothetical protein